jgi:hypothetical protein
LGHFGHAGDVYSIDSEYVVCLLLSMQCTPTQKCGIFVALETFTSSVAAINFNLLKQVVFRGKATYNPKRVCFSVDKSVRWQRQTKCLVDK